ncbi:HutD/Ves family protein [Ideonella dechloratans]|uniref:HutD/Ves family protein n=1 Tax=Ideonella dechloratans TaxID=36863 RepID=UPI0035AEBB5D
MSLHVQSWAQAPEQPWRNGGGRTRELLVWPTPEDWQVRVSVADIDREGQFSPFPGVRRWFQVLSGAGVVLEGDALPLTPDSEPHAFEGALAPHCALVHGPTRDLNLMVRIGPGRMWGARSPWHASPGWRGLYTTQSTTLRAGAHTQTLAPHTLAWSNDTPGHWQIDPPVRAWWLSQEHAA